MRFKVIEVNLLQFFVSFRETPPIQEVKTQELKSEERVLSFDQLPLKEEERVCFAF